MSKEEAMPYLSLLDKGLGHVPVFSRPASPMSYLFGDIYHAEGAYNHDLRELKFNKKNGYYNMWRLEYAKKHNGNLYPTHGLGPVAQTLGINRGDRFDHLTSASTAQYGLSLYAKDNYGENSPEYKQEYKLGDVNNTVIHTVKGKTILIQHNTTSPQPYSRRGNNALYRSLQKRTNGQPR